jgi:hypothetical protein
MILLRVFKYKQKEMPKRAKSSKNWQWNIKKWLKIDS